MTVFHRVGSLIETAGHFLEDHNGAVTAIATVFIAIFTIVLALVTRRQANLTRIVADAAKRSALVAERALAQLERPFVYADITQPGLRFVPSQERAGFYLERQALILSLFNLGRTPANLTRLEYQITTAPRGDIAPFIDPGQVGGRELPIGSVSGAEHPYSEETNLRSWFSGEQQDIVERRQSVWLVGFVRHDDIFGNHNITGFATVFDPIVGRFVSRGGEKYNYAHAERAEEIPPPSSSG